MSELVTTLPNQAVEATATRLPTRCTVTGDRTGAGGGCASPQRSDSIIRLLDFGAHLDIILSI